MDCFVGLKQDSDYSLTKSPGFNKIQEKQITIHFDRYSILDIPIASYFLPWFNFCSIMLFVPFRIGQDGRSYIISYNIFHRVRFIQINYCYGKLVISNPELNASSWILLTWLDRSYVEWFIPSRVSTVFYKYVDFFSCWKVKSRIQ